MSLFTMSNYERNRRKRLRKQRASGKKKGRRTDIPLHHIEAARIRFNAPDGTKGA